MKRTLLTIIILLYILIFPGCVKKETIYFDFVDEFYESPLKASKIAVCTAAAKLRKSETTNIKVRTKGLRQYAYAVARELEESRPCLQVIRPERVFELLPDIYDLISPVRAALQDKKPVNNEAFDSLKNSLGADYLLLVERISFHHGYKQNAFSAVVYQKTSLDYQLWDLNLKKVIVRAKVSSKGEGSENLFKDYDKKTAAVKIARDIAGDLPKCGK